MHARSPITYTYTLIHHAHTHIYIYIYIHMRKSARERECTSSASSQLKLYHIVGGSPLQGPPQEEALYTFTRALSRGGFISLYNKQGRHALFNILYLSILCKSYLSIANNAEFLSTTQSCILHVVLILLVNICIQFEATE